MPSCGLEVRWIFLLVAAVSLEPPLGADKRGDLVGESPWGRQTVSPDQSQSIAGLPV